MNKGVFLLGIFDVIVGLGVLLGTLLTYGQLTYDFSNPGLHTNFWALANFMYMIMVPAAIALIGTGLALAYLGSESY